MPAGLPLLTAFLVGLFCGAMLLIGTVLVPFWQSVPPAEFRAWFAAHAFRIGRLMIPLGLGAALVAVVAAVRTRGSAAARWLALAAAAVVTVGVITAVVNEPANELFAAPGALRDAETSTLLRRWMHWHWVRIALGITGFYAALRAVGAR